MEALKRYRAGGEQKVTVQHVSVSEGGQAIVGNVTQGAPDLLSARWDAATKTLVGRSKLIAGDDYELRVDAGDRKVKSAGDAEVKQDGRFVRVLLHPQQSGEVSWAITFAE